MKRFTRNSSRTNDAGKLDNDYLPSSTRRQSGSSSNDANMSDSSTGTEHDALDGPRKTSHPKEWEVKSVLSKQIMRDASVHYLLEWKNYKGEPTWEPEDNCICPKLIAEFEKNVNRKSSAKDRLSVESKSSSSSETKKTKSKTKSRSVTTSRR